VGYARIIPKKPAPDSFRGEAGFLERSSDKTNTTNGLRPWPFRSSLPGLTRQSIALNS